VKVRGEISGTNYAEVRATHIRNEPINWDTPITDVKLSIQTLTSGAITFSPNGYRIDNAHGFLHEHVSGAMVVHQPIQCMTVSGAITTLFRRN